MIENAELLFNKTQIIKWIAMSCQSNFTMQQSVKHICRLCRLYVDRVLKRYGKVYTTSFGFNETIFYFPLGTELISTNLFPYLL